MRDRALGWLLVASLALLAGALATVALTRPRLVSYDSFDYVDVARNVALGRGLTQSALGYNEPRFPVDGDWPAPFTSQPPLYPLAVAALIRLGLDPVRAGLLVPILALAALWLVAWRLTRALWGPEAAAAAVASLAGAAALTGFGFRAWSELLAIAFALLALALQVRAVGAAAAGARPTSGGSAAFGAGLAAGAAFATRYLFVIAWPVGLAGWLGRGRRGLAQALAFTAGFALVAGPVVARNLLLKGTLAGVGHNPSSESPAMVVARVAKTLAGGWGALALLVAVAALLALLRRRAGSWSAALARVPGAPGWLVALWALAYLVVLVAVRSLVHFDDIGLRLMSPFLVCALLLAAALAARALPLPRAAWLALGVVVALAASGLVLARGLALPHLAPAQRVAASPRLAWVRDHVAPGDLVIGDDPVDLPLYFRGPDGGPRRVASFSPAPYMRPVTAAELLSFARQQTSGWRRPAWLVLRRRDSDPEEWRLQFGPLIADLATGRTAEHPEFHLMADLDDALVFRIGP